MDGSVKTFFIVYYCRCCPGKRKKNESSAAQSLQPIQYMNNQYGYFRIVFLVTICKVCPSMLKSLTCFYIDVGSTTVKKQLLLQNPNHHLLAYSFKVNTIVYDKHLITWASSSFERGRLYRVGRGLFKH
jgi:hypothetical protein